MTVLGIVSSVFLTMLASFAACLFFESIWPMLLFWIAWMGAFIHCMIGQYLVRGAGLPSFGVVVRGTAPSKEDLPLVPLRTPNE